MMAHVADLAACLDPAIPVPPAGVVVARYRSGVIETVARGPVAEDAVFELGSITKVVTGLLLAVAVTRGEVTLETALQTCLAAARPRAPITLGALASHTAGLPRLPLVLLRRRSSLTLSDPYASTTVEELVAHLEHVRVRPDAGMRYSNFGAALLGQALAAAAGMPYEQLVHERVLEPLGITEMWAQGGPPVAQPHARHGRPVQPWRMGAYAPAGCLHGTARGTLAFAVACMQPSGAMAEAIALTLTPRARRRQIESGLGWMRSLLSPGQSIWWHNGGTHGSRAFTAFAPGTQTAVAAATNCSRFLDATGRRALSGSEWSPV